MQVMKFGGSSVANAQNINKVIAIVREALTKDKTIVVTSAISGCTDQLIAIGKAALAQDDSYTGIIDKLEQRHIDLIDELIVNDDSSAIKEECAALFNELREICKGVYLLKELSSLSLDHIVSFGELLSTKIISAKLKSLNISHLWKDSRDLIKTEEIAGKNAVISDVTGKNIKEFFESCSHKLFIMPGFIAMDLKGRTTTLGRGGSDYTASIIAVGVQARILEIWTDVCGMMTADPRIVPQAHPIRNISYKEALELSHFGAKVVYPPTIQPVVKQGIPIYVKNTFEPSDPGTLIERNPPEGNNKIKGISSSNKIALLSMEGSGMVGIPGYSSRLFDTLSKNNVNIILITQASSVHTMCIAIDEADADKAKKATDELFAYEISLGKVDPLRVEKGFSIISLVGDDMKNQSGASGKMFDALGREGINIRAIAQGSSEKNVSAVVQTEYVNDAIRAIHEEFFTSNAHRINLFIAGYGTVSKALVQIIREKREFLLKTLGKELVVCGLCNSKKYILNRNGIALGTEEQMLAQLEGGEPVQSKSQHQTGNLFIEAIGKLKLSNSIFVDCTASKEIAGTYVDLFRNKFSVVACNKIANSLSYDSYCELFNNALAEGVNYRYETTVCAAQPVLAMIRQIINSGDRILKIEGIVSGTLNYLFSCYNTQKSFATLVKEAKELGYTEPDPRLDLSGTDVLRKFIISAREAGEQIERADIDFQGFVPHSLLEPKGATFAEDQESFYAGLEAEEANLKAMYDNAAANGRKLRFAATLDKSKEGEKPVYRVGLIEVDSSHPFYSLEGSDNAMLITTEYYPNGVVIKGAGAGARQTASGLLNDILK
ncbi:MAG: bifunctional aspartate kinase/homoserine dehydrogenase I [Bacteroidales bacterium]|nr:bifunctional aspartate kinase/homoserine dehydrogenase I [Bacteroidales bacterium]